MPAAAIAFGGGHYSTISRVAVFHGRGWRRYLCGRVLVAEAYHKNSPRFWLPRVFMMHGDSAILRSFQNL